MNNTQTNKKKLKVDYRTFLESFFIDALINILFLCLFLFIIRIFICYTNKIL